MTATWSLLRRWRRRTAASRSRLTQTLLVGVAANVVSAGLLVATATLLTYSAGRPSWHRIALWLLIVEIIAFLRSPLRFGERVTRHDVGLSAVTQWRLWLLRTVGGWPIHRWNEAAAGDVLDRALRDTDDLQNLWVRGLLPLISVAITVGFFDVILLLIPANTSLVRLASLFFIQFAAAMIFAALFLRLVHHDRLVRVDRGNLQAALVGLQPALAELTLLEADEFVDGQLHPLSTALNHHEKKYQRTRRWLIVVPGLSVLATLAVISSAHAAESPPRFVAICWLSIALGELLTLGGPAIEALVASIASAERLDELETVPPSIQCEWTDHPLTLAHPSRPIPLPLPPGHRVAVVGPSGSGKSTFLESVAALREEDSPLQLGATSVSLIETSSLRRQLRYVPAEPGLLRGFLRDVITMGEPIPDQTWNQLRRLEISFTPDDFLENLSRGERQRVAVVRALSTSPAVIILDEPTSGLGTSDTKRLLAVLEESGSTVIVATHDPAVVAWCHDVINLAQPLSEAIEAAW